MRKKIVIKYKDGKVFLNDGIGMRINNLKPEIEIDVSEDEFQKIKNNPKEIDKLTKDKKNINIKTSDIFDNSE